MFARFMLVAFLLSILICAGCSGSQSTPEQTIRGFFNTCNKAREDLDGIHGYDSKNARIAEKRLTRFFPEGKTNLNSCPAYPGIILEIKEVNVEPSRAKIIVPYECNLLGKKATPEYTMYLLKQDGKWILSHRNGYNDAARKPE